MALESNKKLSIIYTLEILKEYSDENHLLTQKDIAERIKQIYNMDCERKSIAGNIDSLIDIGIDIIKIPHKGSYIADRTLEPSEVSFIVDALFSSKSINGKQAKDLAIKISSQLSKYQRKKYNYVFKSDQINRTDNKELFYNIEIIQEAIDKNKKILFQYVRPYFEKGNREKPYVINPYFLVNSQGRYYLICNYDYFNEIGNYKVDFIKNIKILEDERKPITEMKGFEKGLDISKYINEHIYVFGKDSITATLKLSDENATTYVYEWFGENAKIYKKDNEIYAEIKSNEQALIYWCLQYGESVELISPKETREKIMGKLSVIQKKYNGG